jgi:ABC-type branched-subunit amino acid transport system substrate-binding protein
VPDETVNIYFLTEPSSPWSDYSQFIRDIKFNGGKGKTGIPWLYWLLTFLMGGAIAGVMIAGINYWARRDHQSFNDRLGEAIQLGASAR